MADIKLTDLTNSTDTTQGTGVFDVLISAVNREINTQFIKGRLAGTDYASVYLGSMQSVLQQSIAFILGEQQAGKQADLMASQIVEQDSKTAMERNLTEAQLEQQWGYDVSRDATTGDLILGALNTTGEIDKKKSLLDEQVTASIARTTRDDLKNTAQIGLVNQQSAGIKEKSKIDYAKSLVDTWGLIYSIKDGTPPFAPTQFQTGTEGITAAITAAKPPA